MKAPLLAALALWRLLAADPSTADDPRAGTDRPAAGSTTPAERVARPPSSAPLPAGVLEFDTVDPGRLQTFVVDLASAPRSTLAEVTTAQDYVKAEIAAQGHPVEIQAIDDMENLIVDFVGETQPDYRIVIGAHLDTVGGSPGADDNASSVAVLLEYLRLMRSHRLDRSLTLIFFAQEETGFGGSRAYANQRSADVDGMISLEMIGYTCGSCQQELAVPPGVDPSCLTLPALGSVGDFTLFGANESSVTLLDRIQSAFPANSARVITADACDDLQELRRSDHASFWDVGIPAVAITDGAITRNPNYHLATDTAETLDYAFMAGVGDATWSFLIDEVGLFPVPTTLDLEGDDLSWNAVGPVDVTRCDEAQCTTGSVCLSDDAGSAGQIVVDEDPGPGDGFYYLASVRRERGGRACD